MGWLSGILLISILALLHASSADRPAALQPPPPVPATKAQAPTADELLARRQLAVPVQGIPRQRLHDTFHAGRGKGRTHRAIDIMAPWGTPVLAADDGKVAKISRNRGGGLAIYQTDTSGRFVYYYAHLAGYAEDLREGQALRRGDVIGFVGTTGNAPDSAPHLHFAVQLLQREGRWWKGEPLNPYPALTHGYATASARD